MKKRINIKTGMCLILAVLLVASLGCNQPATEENKQDETTATEQSVKPNCEVEKKGQQVQNKLLVSVENMKSTINKLHEVLEEHNHADIKEHAEEVEGYALDLMKKSVYLPMNNFNKFHENSKIVLSLSTQYAWENKYCDFAENSRTFDALEIAINGLQNDVKGMNDIPETICETEKNIARKEIYIHLYIMKIYFDQIDKAAEKDCLHCVEEYCEKLEVIVKTFRETITNIGTDDFTTLNRTLADIEHTVHEMKEKAEAGEKEELHHAHETIMRHIKRLKDEVDEIS
jgi:hypothetical protein